MSSMPRLVGNHDARPEVRVSLRSALAILGGIALTVLLLEIARDTERVIAWVLAAAAIAALVQPLVSFFARFMSRGLAVFVVFVLVLGSLGFLTYRVVHGVGEQTHRLQQAAPERARQLERDSSLLREIKFTRRVEQFVDAIPQRLRGGTPAQALRSAANRGLAAIAGLVLTLFFVLYGPALVDGGIAQVRDPDRRARVERVVRGAARSGLGYARVQLLLAATAGVLAFVIGWLAGVPGPAALGAWVALWSLIPIAGLFIGAIPVVAFAAATSTVSAVLVALAFVAIGVGSAYVARVLERRVLHVGSFLTALALFTGLELYGFTGALLLLLGMIMVVAVVAEIGPEEVAETVLAPLAGTDESGEEAATDAAIEAPRPPGSVGPEDDGTGR
jgi:predicted PurR-regulated permease PerM